jgi:hypothetical protein
MFPSIPIILIAPATCRHKPRQPTSLVSKRSKTTSADASTKDGKVRILSCT